VRRFAIACAWSLLSAYSALAGIDVWTGNGPYPGYVDMVGIIPGHPPTYLANSYSHQVIRSTDFGSTWAVVTQISKSAYESAFVPSDAKGTAFVAAGRVYRTTDWGATWADTGVFARSVTGDASGQIVVAPEAFSVHRSTDGGTTWSSSEGPGFQAPIAILLSPVDRSEMHLIGTAGFSNEDFWKSTDAGVTWVRWGEVDADYGVKPFLSSLEGAPWRLYASASGVMESTDGGTSWTGLVAEPYAAARSFVPASLDGSDLIFGTTFGLFRSTDSGVSWGVPHPELAFVQVDGLASDSSAPGSLLAATWAGVLHSNDAGASWDVLNGGPIADVWTVAGDPYAVGTFYAGTRGNIFKTTDSGVEWERLTGLGHDEVTSIIVLSDARSTVIAGTARGAYRSVDGGLTWTLSSGLTYEGPDGPFEPAITELVSAPGTCEVAYADIGGAAYRSTDAGASWQTFSQYHTVSPEYGIDAIGVDPFQSGMVYAVSNGDSVFASIDGTVTWTYLGTLYPAVDGMPTKIRVDPASAGRLYVGTNVGLARSTDGGATFENITNGIAQPNYINEIIFDPPSGKLFVAADSGTYVSTDGGDSWAPFGSLPSGAIAKSLTRSPADPSHLLCGTLNNGAFSLTLGDYPIARGDVNADGTRDVRDVFSLIDLLFAGSASPGGRLDANGDGHVDVADVFYLVNYLFAGGPPPPGMP
jgi:photosystem II stability/assembly factor-like uncharacterized protein